MPKKEVSECVACAVRSIYATGLIFGVTNVIPSCEHSNKLLFRPTFKISIIHQLLEFLGLCLLICAVGTFVQSVLGTAQEEFDVLILLSDLFFCCNGIVLGFLATFNSKAKVDYLNSWSLMAEKRGRFYIKTLISAKALKMIQRRGLLLGSIPFGLGAMVLYVKIVKRQPFQIRNCALIYTSLLHLIVTSQVTIETRTISAIYSSWRFSVKKLLNGSLKSPSRSYPTLVRQLGALRAFYKVCRRNGIIMESWFGPAFILWIIFVMLILVFNIFLLGEMWHLGKYDRESFVLEARTVAILMLLMNFVGAVQGVYDSVSGLIVFWVETFDVLNARLIINKVVLIK